VKQSNESMLNLWYMALPTPYGVEVECVPDYEHIRDKLYRLRNEVKDDDLKRISICQSPFDPGRLWLVKRESDDAKT
jgi:hypothetical protein